MLQYFLRRILLIPPTFLGITLMVFAITRFVPGGPIESMILQMQMGAGEGGHGGGSQNMSKGGQALSDEQLADLRAYYGFDKPTPLAYWEWLTKVMRFDLGHSTRYGDPVWDTIKQRFPVSVFYGVVAMILTYAVCIPLGIVKAVRHKSMIDNVTSFIVFVGYAVPGFVVGIALLVLFAARWEWFPMGGFTSDGFAALSAFNKALDIIRHAALPLMAYMAGSFAVETFMMKNSLMDNLAADYVRTAMAKGLDFKTTVLRHALQNSLIPIATHFGNNISVLIAGSFLIEKIFNIDGFGLLGYESVVQRDYPVVMGILVLSSLLQLLGNILSDLCVALVDPRVQFH